MRKRSDLEAPTTRTQKERTQTEVRRLLAHYDILRDIQTNLVALSREPQDASLAFTPRGHYGALTDALSSLLTRLHMEVQGIPFQPEGPKVCAQCHDTGYLRQGAPGEEYVAPCGACQLGATSP
jgi:hypothetical protein